MKLTPRLSEHNKRLLFIAVFYTLLVAFLCLRSAPILISLADGFDKIGHAGFHFGIVTIWFLYLKSKKINVDTSVALMQSLLFSFLFGVGIEYCQEHFTENRTADINDVYANYIGALLAAFIIILFPKKSFSLER